GKAAPAAFASNLAVEGFAHTDAGTVRSVNEDSVALHFGVPGGSSATLALVADGMGGTSGGAIASDIAAKSIPRLFFESTLKPKKALERAIVSAGRQIWEVAQQNPELEGMGTRCVALVISPPLAWAAWVGDSRLYVVRDAAIARLTRDHSVVEEMIRSG